MHTKAGNQGRQCTMLHKTIENLIFKFLWHPDINTEPLQHIYPHQQGGRSRAVKRCCVHVARCLRNCSKLAGVELSEGAVAVLLAVCKLISRLLCCGNGCADCYADSALLAVLINGVVFMNVCTCSVLSPYRY